MKYPPVIPSMPHFLHGGDYNPDQWRKWKDEIWPEDMRLAKLAGCNVMSVGIFSWVALEPEENVYDFSWLDEVMDLLAANGMVAALATPSGARPAWMSKKYPEVLRVTPERRRMLQGGRHNHCLTSPVYREKVTSINTMLAERYKEHPALGMWHISNEYGGECHCALCQAKFREYLKKRYGSLDALNTAYWTAFWSKTYTDWEQIESPSPLGETTAHCLVLDWKRFTTEQFVDFMNCETAPLRAITPDKKLTTNMMGTYPGINYFRLADVMDVASWDSYPVWRGTDEDEGVAIRNSFLNDLTRGLKDGRPFMLMESSPSATNWTPICKLRRPGGHKLYSLQAVAHGSDTVQYFQFRKSRGSAEKFHGAIVDHEGSENTRIFREVASVGETLAKLDEVFGTPVPAKVAIVYDWENRWAIDESKGMLQENCYETEVIKHYASFWRQGINCDIIDETKSPEGYNLLIAPMLYMLRAGFADKLRGYVEKGGTLVTTYMTGWVDESDLCFLGGFPGPLKDVLGVWCEEIDALYPEDGNSTNWKGKKYSLHSLCELSHLRSAEALAVYNEDFYAGMPTLTRNYYGKGKAYYMAARSEQAFLDDFYTSLSAELALPRVLKAELPFGCTASCRTDGKHNYIFVMNFGPTSRTVDVEEGGIDMETGAAISGIIKLPARSCRIIRR
ncbi:MAG: beta-galactosidase [Christensenellales bacterium]|jgi:beta-galactosidase